MAKFSVRDYLELLKLLRLDVYFMLALVGSGMPSVTINQLAQDKYCVNIYSANESDCLNLENAGIESIRNQVLEKATTLKMYTTVITTVPGILSSLFLGYWIDTYPGHIRYILTLGPLAVVIQNLMIIYQCLNFETAPMSLLYTYTLVALTSNLVMTGAYTYATRETPAKYRAIRFTVMEVFVFAAMPLSSTLGGVLLGIEPWFSYQLRNYIGVFIVSTVWSTIAMIWVLTTIKRTSSPVDSGVTKEVNREIGKDTVESGGPSDHPDTNENENRKTVMKMIFDIFHWRNVICTLKTAFKPRENNQRAALLTTMVSMVVCMIGYMGENSIGLQYAQRVYHWSSEYYSYMGSIIIILPAIVTIVTPPILIHKFNLHDTALGILGSISLTVAMFIRGLFLSAPAFFPAIMSGSFIGLLPIANRSIISRMIHKDEIGQIYAILASIEPAGPLIASVLFTSIFNATIESSPGTVYIVTGFIVSFPACVMIWLYFTRNQWDLVLLEEKVSAKSSNVPESGVNTDDSVESPSFVMNTKSRISYQNENNVA